MGDFNQCLSQLQLDLITLLVNLSYELRPIIIKYDFFRYQTSEFEQWLNWYQLDLLISPNEVFGDIMVLASPPPVDPDDVNTLNSENIQPISFNFIWG